MAFVTILDQGRCYKLEKIAFSFQIRLLEVESNPAMAVSLIKFEHQDFHPMTTLVNNCKVLMLQFDSYMLPFYVHREKNYVADLLAKYSTNSSYGTMFFRHPRSYCVCCS